jgi:RND family efflux transporter MFP subunit
MTSSVSPARSRPRRCALIALVFLPAGCHRAPQAAEEKVPPAPVKWEAARQLFLEEWTELVGTSQPLPDHAARVTAPVEGRVLTVLNGAAGKPVVEGQAVQKGDVLVQLDATVVRNHRDKAVEAKNVLRAEKDVAEFAIKQAELEVKRLNELKRQQDARPRDGLQLVSPIELEAKGVALEAAKAGVRAFDRKLEAADKDVAALDHELQLYSLTAPRAGRLGRLQVVVGQTLAVGAVVADIVDIEDEIDVLCFVPAADARKLQVGQVARVGGVEKDPAAEPGPDPEGKVEYIADQAEAETGTLAVKVRFPNRDLKLRANAVVRIRVLTKPGKACWAVPEAALMEDQDPPGVVVVEDVEVKKNADGKEEETGKARRLKVVTGVRDRVLHQVEILRLEDPEKKWQGDLEHALIVVEKGQGLQTGDAVRLEQDEDEAPPPPKPEEKKG